MDPAIEQSTHHREATFCSLGASNELCESCKLTDEDENCVADEFRRQLVQQRVLPAVDAADGGHVRRHRNFLGPDHVALNQSLSKGSCPATSDGGDGSTEALEGYARVGHIPVGLIGSCGREDRVYPPRTSLR